MKSRFAVKFLFIGGSALLASALLPRPGMGQGRELPRPTGPRPVGLASVVLRDPARREELVVRLWYPGPSAARSRLPLVLISPAVGVGPTNYAAIGEDLASHGFVVAALGHPPSTSGPNDNPLDVARRDILTRAADLRFVLTRLIDSAGQSVPGLRIDAGRTVVAGHSRGGVAALEACKRDARFRACVNMDGGVLGGPYYNDSTGEGPKAPTLWFQARHIPPSDSLLRVWNMTRVQWDSFDLRANRQLARARGGAWRVILPDTAHMAFSDLEFLQADSAHTDSALATLDTVRLVLRTFIATVSRGDTRVWDRASLAPSRLTIQRISESNQP
jgi:dienelactone hydrolase